MFRIFVLGLTRPKVILEPLTADQLEHYYKPKREIQDEEKQDEEKEQEEKRPRKIRRAAQRSLEIIKNFASNKIETLEVDLSPSELIENSDDFSNPPNESSPSPPAVPPQDEDDDEYGPAEPTANNNNCFSKPKKTRIRRNYLDYATPCIKCDQVFPSKRKRDQHLLQVHNHDVRNFCRYCQADLSSCLVKNEPESQDSTSVTDPQLETDNNSSTGIYICTLDNCQGRRYKTVADLWEHHRKLCLANPTVAAQLSTEHPCPSCPMKFRQALNLRYHIRNVHEKNFKFACEHCGKGFQIQYALQAHIDTVHVTEGKFQCQICPERFKQSKQLKEHLVKHTGEKPFVCHLCGKGFHRRELLKKHIENMHPTGSFPCNLCGKSFKSRNYVRNHMNNAHKLGYTLKKNGPIEGSESQPSCEDTAGSEQAQVAQNGNNNATGTDFSVV